MLRGSFYYIRARRVASTDCSKQWNRIDTQFERKYTKDTSMCIYIIYILYTLDANRYNLFHFHYLGQRLHFEFLSEFFLLTSRLPAPLFILFYLASSRCNSLPPYVSIAQVEGEGGGKITRQTRPTSRNAFILAEFPFGQGSMCPSSLRDTRVQSRFYLPPLFLDREVKLKMVENYIGMYYCVYIYIYWKIIFSFFSFFFYLFLGRNAT